MTAPRPRAVIAGKNARVSSTGAVRLHLDPAGAYPGDHLVHGALVGQVDDQRFGPHAAGVPQPRRDIGDRRVIGHQQDSGAAGRQAAGVGEADPRGRPGHQ
jgi:hypothetical protein